VREIKLGVWIVLREALQVEESDWLFADLTVLDTQVDL
jgi:hypothetical protein